MHLSLDTGINRTSGDLRPTELRVGPADATFPAEVHDDAHHDDGQDKKLDDQVEASAFIVVGGVDAAAAVEQQLDALEVARARQLAELAALLALIPHQLAAPLANELRDLGVPLAHRVDKRRPTPSILHVDVGAKGDELLHNVQIANTCSEVETGAFIICTQASGPQNV